MTNYVRLFLSLKLLEMKILHRYAALYRYASKHLFCLRQKYYLFVRFCLDLRWRILLLSFDLSHCRFFTRPPSRTWKPCSDWKVRSNEGRKNEVTRRNGSSEEKGSLVVSEGKRFLLQGEGREWVECKASIPLAYASAFPFLLSSGGYWQLFVHPASSQLRSNQRKLLQSRHRKMRTRFVGLFTVVYQHA